MDKITLTVKSVCIPYSNKYLGKLRLHILQEKVYNLVNKGRNILLNAPTGSGKTLTLLLAREYGGAVGIYPNNTLLLNQRDSLGDIIVKYSGQAQCIGYYDSEKGELKNGCPNYIPNSPMIVYRVRGEGVLEGYNHIVLFTISSKTLERYEGSPKREILYFLVEKAYSYRNPYIVTLTTPDTFLLLYSGAYRDFENVGKLVHNLLRLIAEGAGAKRIEDELRKSGTVARQTVAPIIGIKARLLEFPLFIDEFHLYGLYELDALYAILKLNKEVSVEEYPVVFSSATPAKETLEYLKNSLGLNYNEVNYVYESECSSGFKVRGRTEVEIVGVDTGYKNTGAYYHVGDYVPEILDEKYLDNIKATVGEGSNVLVILDRVYQVYRAVESFIGKRLEPVRCYVSIPHPRCADEGNIIVGAQRITQGVNIDNVRFLASTAVSVEDAVQRFGRSGRRGVDSHVVLFTPRHRLNAVLDYDSKTLTYSEFTNNVLGRLYLDITYRQRDFTNRYNQLHSIRRRLIYSVTVVSIARVAGQYRIIRNAIKDIDRDTALFISEELVFGDPMIYALLLKFRKTGFKARYRIVSSHDEPREEDIGIIIRNARVVNSKGGVLVIDPWNAPRTVKERDILVLDASTIKSRLVRGKITRLNYLRNRYDVEINILNSEIKPVSDVLLFILRTPPEPDFALFLVQSGEAVIVDFGGSSTLALFL